MNLLTELTTLVLEFKQIQSDGKTPYSNFYLKSKVETIVSKILMMYKGQEYKSQIIILIFQSIILQLVAVISNYQKKIDHPRKGLINIQNAVDNE